MSLAIAFLIALALVVGWYGHSAFGGRWKKVKNPSPASDLAHFWVNIRGDAHAFTIEQLAVGRERASLLEKK